MSPDQEKKGREETTIKVDKQTPPQGGVFYFLWCWRWCRIDDRQGKVFDLRHFGN